MSADRPDIERLRACVAAEKYEWKRHAAERIVKRGISVEEVLETIARGLCIRNYPEDQPWPSALLFATVNGRPLHVVAALRDDGEMSAIITAYEPSNDFFELDFKTRKKT